MSCTRSRRGSSTRRDVNLLRLPPRWTLRLCFSVTLSEYRDKWPLPEFTLSLSVSSPAIVHALHEFITHPAVRREQPSARLQCCKAASHSSFPHQHYSWGCGLESKWFEEPAPLWLSSRLLWHPPQLWNKSSGGYSWANTLKKKEKERKTV